MLLLCLHHHFEAKEKTESYILRDVEQKEKMFIVTRQHKVNVYLEEIYSWLEKVMFIFCRLFQGGWFDFVWFIIFCYKILTLTSFSFLIFFPYYKLLIKDHWTSISLIVTLPNWFLTNKVPNQTYKTHFSSLIPVNHQCYSNFRAFEARRNPLYDQEV